MASPFPGMDPYLEGYLWPDVHNSLSTVIKEQLAPLIQPNYVARLELYTVQDSHVEKDIGIMYPDVEVLRRADKAEEPEVSYANSTATITTTPPTLTLTHLDPIEVRIPVIELRDRGNNQLITAIELLSPVNKRKPGLEPYRSKRLRLHEAGIHLVEIDLIRRGERPIRHPRLPQQHYLCSLWRGGLAQIELWAFNFNDPLPVLPIPLKAPDKDVPLDLGKALRTIYKRGYYHLSVNYEESPPPPELSTEETADLKNMLNPKTPPAPPPLKS
jgi:hypothetical protein